MNSIGPQRDRPSHFPETTNSGAIEQELLPSRPKDWFAARF
jgi:hypothetical protein